MICTRSWSTSHSLSVCVPLALQGCSCSFMFVLRLGGHQHQWSDWPDSARRRRLWGQQRPSVCGREHWSCPGVRVVLSCCDTPHALSSGGNDIGSPPNPARPLHSQEPLFHLSPVSTQPALPLCPVPGGEGGPRHKWRIPSSTAIAHCCSVPKWEWNSRPL